MMIVITIIIIIIIIKETLLTHTRSIDWRFFFLFLFFSPLPANGSSSIIVTAQTCLLNSSALLSSMADIELRPW